MRKANDYGIKKCAWCGKEYRATSGNQSYCSKECKDKAHEASCKRADAIINASKEEGYVRHCLNCGREFKGKRRTTMYCSTTCRNQAKESRKKITSEKYIVYGQRKEFKNQRKEAPPRKTDGFTWDEIRAVLKECEISSYHKAIEILEQRKKEKHNDLQRKNDG